MPIDPSIALQAKLPQLENPTDMLARVLQLRGLQQQQQLQQQQGLLQQEQLRGAQMQNTAAQRGLDEDEQIRKALEQSGGDISKALPAITQISPTKGIALRKSIDEQRKAQIEQSLSHAKLVTHVLQGVTDQHSFEAAKQMLSPFGDVSEFGDTYDPARIQAIMKQGMEASELLTAEKNKAEMEAKAREEKDKNAKAAAGELVPGSELLGSDGIRTAEYRFRQPDGSYTRKRLEMGKQGQLPTPPMSDARFKQEEDLRNISAGTDAAVALTPEGLDQAARRYLQDGTLPPMGMGKAGGAARTRIINRAAEIDPQAAIAANRANYLADTESLKALTKQKDAIGSFENTALKNLNAFLDSAKKVVDAGSPFLNTPVRMIDAKLVGGANIAVFNAARQIAVNEIAKITNNPTLAGTLSDNARHEVESLIPENATLAQIYAVANLLKNDMANRKTSVDAQIKEINERLKPSGSGKVEELEFGPDGKLRPKKP